MQWDQYLQVWIAITKLITRGGWECTSINITCVFNTFSLSTCNFPPKFSFHIRWRKTSGTTISTRKNLVCHFLIISKGIIPSTHEESDPIICIPFSKTQRLHSGGKLKSCFLFHQNYTSRNRCIQRGYDLAYTWTLKRRQNQ